VIKDIRRAVRKPYGGGEKVRIGLRAGGLECLPVCLTVIMAIRSDWPGRQMHAEMRNKANVESASRYLRQQAPAIIGQQEPLSPK